MADMPYPKKPCPECPWSTLTPPGQFSAERYRELRKTTGQNGFGAEYNAPMFACHKSLEGQDLPCAGWLAAVGGDMNPMVRIAIAQGRLPRSALQPGPDWPPLFETYEEMEATQAAKPQPRRRR
jgi:hypothetical protein